MTRGGDDFHARSVAWLENGARDDPPRDIAVHANSCPICAMQAAALDGLAIIDPGRAVRPPSRLGPLALAPSVTWNRAAIVVGAILLTVGIGAVASSLIRGTTPLPEGGLLGGVGTPAATASPTPSLDATGTPSGSASASATDSSTPIPTATTGAGATKPPFATPPPPPPFATPSPPFVTPPPFFTPRPTIVPTPVPTAVPTPIPTPIPTPVATPVPTPVPTATPTPTASPTPVLDDCADGIDNDGDLLIDGLDPGCLRDGNEASA